MKHALCILFVVLLFVLCTALNGCNVVGLFYVAASFCSYKTTNTFRLHTVASYFPVISSYQLETEAIKQQQYWKLKLWYSEKRIFNRDTS